MAAILFVSFRFDLFCFVSFRFDLFRFVSICFVSFRFVSFRSVSVSFRTLQGPQNRHRCWIMQAYWGKKAVSSKKNVSVSETIHSLVGSRVINP